MNFDLIAIIIGSLYLVSVILTKELSIFKIILSILVLLSMAPLDTHTYLITLSSYCMVLALMFLHQKEITAYKYFIAVFLLISMNVDVFMPHYKFLLFALTICGAFFASDKSEIKNTYVYISNLTILSGIVLRTNDISNKEVIGTIILITLLASIVRFIFSRVSSLLYLLPLMLIATILNDTLTLISLLAYSLYVAVFSHTKRQHLVMVLVFMLTFIDSNIFHEIVKNVIILDTNFDNTYISWALPILLAICLAKYLEPELKRSDLKFSYKTILFTIIPAVILSTKIIQNSEASITLPIPLFAAIPLIFIEARYISLFQKLSIKIKTNIHKKVFYSIRYVVILPSRIRLSKIRNSINKKISYIDQETRSENYTILLVAAILGAMALILIYGDLI